jgi:hypothetical protein
MAALDTALRRAGQAAHWLRGTTPVPEADLPPPAPADTEAPSDNR